MDTTGTPTDEPRGLAKSLDDLISEQRKTQRQSKEKRKKQTNNERQRRNNSNHQDGRDRKRRDDIDKILHEKVFRVKQVPAHKRRYTPRHEQYVSRNQHRYRDDQYRGRREPQHSRGRGRGRARGRGRGRGRQHHDGSMDPEYAGHSDPAVEQQEKAALAGLERQTCLLNNEGNVAITFDGTDVVQIAQNGDVKIHLSGKRDDELVESLNYTLSPIGIKLTKKGEDMSVSDGRALVRYNDGIVLGGKGNMFRGSMVMTAFHGQ